MPLMVYPEVLIHPNFSIEGPVAHILLSADQTGFNAAWVDSWCLLFLSQGFRKL